MAQRRTQTAIYWEEQFKLSSSDIEFLYNLFIENNIPRSIESLSLNLIQKHCQEEEIEIRSELQKGKLYQPRNSFSIGDQIVFPRFEYVIGQVVEIHPGKHPRFGQFKIINVAFSGAPKNVEFAAEFAYEHSLNLDEGKALAAAAGILSPQAIYAKYGEKINKQMSHDLKEHPEFIHYSYTWYLKESLPDIHIGYLNIAEADIEINKEPQTTEDLLKNLDLASDIDPNVARFAVNFALCGDARFVDVGTKEETRWYLSRLVPAEVNTPPKALQSEEVNYDKASFDSDLIPLLAEIDDEATPFADQSVFDASIEAATLTINYPHRQAGTLPITRKVAALFPDRADHPVMIKLIDSRSKEEMLGWIVPHLNYVYGLEIWYARYDLPVGAYIRLKKSADGSAVILDFAQRRPIREWIRVASVENNRLSFRMEKRLIPCEYDDLLIIGESNPAELTSQRQKLQEKYRSSFELICMIFPELSKLNPQSTVHAKTLYSALNIIRRAPPGILFQQLSTHDCFIPMGHGYWTYDPALKN